MKTVKRYKNVAIVASTYVCVYLLSRAVFIGRGATITGIAFLAGFLLGALPMLTSGRRRAWFCSWAIWIPIAGMLFYIYAPELWVKGSTGDFESPILQEIPLFFLGFAVPLCFLSEGRLTRGRVLLIALPSLLWILLPFVPGSLVLPERLSIAGGFNAIAPGSLLCHIAPVAMGACLPRIELRVPKWAVLAIVILMLIPYSIMLLYDINKTFLFSDSYTVMKNIVFSTIYRYPYSIGGLCLFGGLIGVFIREFIEQATASRHARRRKALNRLEHEELAEG